MKLNTSLTHSRHGRSRWASLVATFTLSAAAFAASPPVLSPSAPVLGRSYGDWSEEWWQWVYSMPVTANPVFDTADVSAGQRGKVWFLGGNFTGTPVVRSGVIPGGKLLFFPIFNTMVDATECSNGERVSNGLSAEFLRTLLTPSMDAASELSVEVDGVPVPGLSNPQSTAFRVQTPSRQGFSYSIPGQDSLNAAFGYPCWSNTTGAPIRVDARLYHAVGDGYYVMLAPLSPGTHSIHIGAASTFGATQDVTYSLTVLPDSE